MGLFRRGPDKLSCTLPMLPHIACCLAGLALASLPLHAAC